MKTLLSLYPIIKNPLEIYKYDKVILNKSMYSCNTNICITDINLYLTLIFRTYYMEKNTEYFNSFKYFIKICCKKRKIFN